jgi:single-strand DNA-binding protein
MTYQKLIIVGNLGGDPEQRFTKDGVPVTTFSLATNRKWDGGEEVTWFRVTCWRRTAEIASDYLKKGRQVMIEGRLTPDENGGPRLWTGNDGKPRASYEVTADHLTLLGKQETTPDDGVPF